jgi:hypothetical protein
LCPYHHRLGHEGGWTIEGDPKGELPFIRPDGTVFPQDPAPLADDWWDRFLAGFHSYADRTGPTGTDPPDTS